MRIAGITDLGVGSSATAVIGTVSTFCLPGQVCGTLPVTFPVQTSLCYGNGTLEIGSDEWPITSTFTDAYEFIVPLCKNGPGSVGPAAMALLDPEWDAGPRQRDHEPLQPGSDAACMGLYIRRQPECPLG